jgi:putative addiction module killer protein
MLHLCCKRGAMGKASTFGAMSILIDDSHTLSILVDMNEIEQTELFEAWLDSLNDRDAQKAIVREIVKMRGGLFGDHKSLGDKVAEARIHHGPGYRLYYTKIGKTIYLMLGGGTKKTQRSDIETAIKLSKEWRQQDNFDETKNEKADKEPRKK